jgi:uroporphyrin-III C-methyltransferase
MSTGNIHIHKVYITGAGPGDPDLLTIKARRVLEQAEVVLYDNLINQEILEWVPAACEKIFVGKLPYCSSIGQDVINDMLLQNALAGKKVVRLKGGAPLVFGRGAEEAQYLVERGIEVEIIPGITSGIGAAAYAGIPLTHRDASQSVLFITGHRKNSNATGLAFNWPLLAAFDGTLVFYMGVKNISEIAGELIAHGKRADTPVAIIENGTLPQQKVVTGWLNNIAGKATAIGTPALIIVGEVVKYREQIQWFEKNIPAGATHSTQLNTLPHLIIK